MPNWIRGNMKLIGKVGNIKKFLLERLSADDREIYEDKNKLVIRSKKSFYIEGTKRNLIADDIEFNYEDGEITIDNFIAAWSIDPEPYIQMSQEYKINIEVGGVEIYGGFVQQIEIKKGEIILNNFEKISLDFRNGDEEFNDEELTSNEDFYEFDWKPSDYTDDDLPF